MVSTHQRDGRINRTRLTDFHEALPQGSAFVYLHKKQEAAMRTLKRKWTSPNEWLLKEAASILNPQQHKTIRDKGEGRVEVIVHDSASRFVCGVVEMTELRTASKGNKRYKHTIGQIEIAFVITATDQFLPIPVEIEWIDEDPAA